MKDWVRMPNLWITNMENPGLKRFTSQDAGVSIAAIILYIALTHEANDKSKRDNHLYGYVDLTYDELASITLLSRAMISRGLRKLKDIGLIEIYNEGRKNIYNLKNNSIDVRFGKLPKLYFIKNNAFGMFNHRGYNELSALKLYLLFIAFRSTNLNAALIAYPKISEYTGIPEYKIRTGFPVQLVLKNGEKINLII